jgi:hypothetical protein
MELAVVGEGEGWPFIRRVTVCPVCGGQKVVGKLVCETCRINRTPIEIIPALKRTEQSMRWNAEREPDKPAAPRATDPKLRPCPKCEAIGAVFMKFQVPGKEVSAERIAPIINYYVLCNSCGCQTLPRSSKRLTADMWTAGDVAKL